MNTKSFAAPDTDDVKVRFPLVYPLESLELFSTKMNYPCHVPLKSVSSSFATQNFTDNQSFILESYEEEEFFTQYLKLSLTFAGDRRAPPWLAMSYKMNNMMLQSSCIQRSILVFDCLHQLRSLGLLTSKNIKLSLIDILDLWNVVLSENIGDNKSEPATCLERYNAFLYLKFVAELISLDLSRYKKRTMKSLAFQIFAPQKGRTEMVLDFVQQALTFPRDAVIIGSCSSCCGNTKLHVDRLECVKIAQSLLDSLFKIRKSNSRTRMEHLVECYAQMYRRLRHPSERYDSLSSIPSQELKMLTAYAVHADLCEDTVLALNSPGNKISVSKVVKKSIHQISTGTDQEEDKEGFSRVESEELVFLMSTIINSYLICHQKLIDAGSTLPTADALVLNSMSGHVERLSTLLADVTLDGLSFRTKFMLKALQNKCAEFSWS